MNRTSTTSSIPSVSFADNLRFNFFHILPNFLQGLFSKQPFWVRLFNRLETDRRAIGLVRRWRSKYGGDLIWVRVLGSKSLLALGSVAIREVLERSPQIYGPPKLKTKGMSHFQPHSLTLSQGELWQHRREFNEQILGTGQAIHRQAASFLRVVREEVTELQRPNSGELAWGDFSQLFEQITLRVVFGDDGAEHTHLTGALKQLMKQSNRVFALRRGEEFETLYSGIRQHLGDSDSAADLAAAAGQVASNAETKAEHQIPHWMFAMKDTLAANAYRALALITSFPDVEARVRQELAAVDLDDPRATASMPYLESCLQEAMRIWPTTPLLSRQALSNDHLAGAPVAAGTQVLIFNLFNHRDRERFEFADRFAPEIWDNDEARGWFNHFSNGPQVCAGVDLALMLGKTVLADLLANYRFEPTEPKLEADKPLPYSLNYFDLRFRQVALESRPPSVNELPPEQSSAGGTPMTEPQNDPLAAKVAGLTLEDLTDMSIAELDELFLWASTPSIRDLDGATDGRALAGKLPADHLPWMPWKGKFFEPLSDTEGRGKNRIESTFTDLFKFELFEFHTRIVPPLQGEDDVFMLDYDLKGNPGLIRRIRDDLKKLKDGLFLGTANLKRDGKFKFILYFALELKK